MYSYTKQHNNLIEAEVTAELIVSCGRERAWPTDKIKIFVRAARVNDGAAVRPAWRNPQDE